MLIVGITETQGNESSGGKKTMSSTGSRVERF